MKKWFTPHHLPLTLIVGGLALNLIDVATTQAGTTTGGKIFGSSGVLKGINDSLPVVTIPGTKTDTAPVGTALNLGGYMIAVGVIWWLIRKFV